MFFGLARQVVGERIIAEAVASSVEGRLQSPIHARYSRTEPEVRGCNC